MPRHQFEPLFENLEGLILVVPAISTLCPDWPLGINPHLESIHDDFWKWVNHWFKEDRIRKKISKLDAMGFAAMNYPEAARDQLLTMARLIAWYFPWDDAIDDGSLYYKPETLIQYREDTISCIQQSLSSIPDTQRKPHPNPAIESFWELGVDIAARGKPAKHFQLRGVAATNQVDADFASRFVDIAAHALERLLAKIRNIAETNEQFQWAQCAFIESSVEGQVDRELIEPIPVEQYLTRREKNIAVFPLLSLIYYNYQLEIPQEFTFHQNTSMNIMWRLLARMGIISNDLLSMRREIMHGQYESLIPLLMYHDGLQAQKAIDRACDMLHECYRKFNEVEIKFKEEVPAELHPTITKYLKSCKDLIVCNLHWSYGLRRYMEPGMLQPDGRVVFPIKLPPKEKAPSINANTNIDTP